MARALVAAMALRSLKRTCRSTVETFPKRLHTTMHTTFFSNNRQHRDINTQPDRDINTRITISTHKKPVLSFSEH